MQRMPFTLTSPVMNRLHEQQSSDHPSGICQIALFGTSADPPHWGHQAILQWLAQHFDQVAVWAADNPFKQHQSTLSARFTMLRLLIDELPDPHDNVQLYPELSHARSIVTIEQARQRWPQAELTLVIGADLVTQLPQWYRSADIFAQVKILIFPRPGYPLLEDDLMELRQQGAQVAIADMPALYDVSSSRYRQSDRPTELPPVIQAYIDQHDLYPCPENSREKLPTR